MCSKSKLRVVFGMQEKIFDNPRFSFVADTLKHVSDRFTQMIITKEATSYVVSERILKNTPEQKALEAKLDTIYGSEELRERFAEILISETMTDTEPYHKVARSVIDAYMERDCDALLTSICGWSISSLAEKVLNNQ